MRRKISVLCTKPVEVVSIACDDWIVVACLSDGLAKVYNIDRKGDNYNISIDQVELQLKPF